MHADRTCAPAHLQEPATDATACVTRGWADPRKVYVPVSELRGARMFTERPGDRRPLPQPMLGAYMFCHLTAGRPFGHSCGHKRGSGPDGAHSIGVLLHRCDNHPAVYARLREEAEHRTANWQAAA
jgi:hypothetical protein